MSEETNEVRDDLGQEESQEKDWQAEAAKWRDIAKRNEAKLEKAKQSISDEEPPKEQPPAPGDYVPRSELERVELRVQGYSDDEIQFIQRNGGVKAAEDPLVKSAIKSMRAEKEAEAAVVSQDGGQSTSRQGYTPDQVKKMSPKEYREKILEQ